MEEDGEIHCLSFTYPLMGYETDLKESSMVLKEEMTWVKDYPSWHGAIEKWNRLSKVICTDNTDVPLKQMAIKAKHEKLIYEEIFYNFARGKPITEQRKKLINLDENMKFKGCPTDKAYIRKVRPNSHKVTSKTGSKNKSRISARDPFE